MKSTKNLKYAGQPLANGIDKDSLLRFPAQDKGDTCCKDLQEACEDSVTTVVGSSTKITGFDLGGTEHVHPTGFLRTQTDALLDWMAEEVMKEEIDARINVSFDGTDKVTIQHVGVLKLDNVKVGAATKTTTRKCELKTYVKSKANLIGDAGNANKVTVMVADVGVELANAVVFDAADAAANTATAAQLKTDLEAVWGAGSVISSTPDDTCGCYEVVYEVEAGTGNFSYNGQVIDTVQKFV